MSYEGKMLEDLAMPTRKDVEHALLKTLFNHNGVIKEFATGEEIVTEIANDFNLDEKQRTVVLERIYRKENRIVKTALWHRLLYRAADSLAKDKLVSRPTTTILLTKKKEWMLTENGYDEALKLLNIPKAQKEFLSTKSFEVQKIVKKLKETVRPDNYDPIDKNKKFIKTTRDAVLRTRGFRQAVIEAYDYKCAVCGMKLNSPNSSFWEVEAAHIVPHSSMGKDDIWNGLSLCRLHHWAFDVGWFTLLDDYTVKASSKLNHLPKGYGQMGEYNFSRQLTDNSSKLFLPKRKEMFPHVNSIRWHREKFFIEQNRGER
ncbi:MAG: HNH endonuclease [Ignavibacteriaceae bacterium]|nr:HNH endonuclease [Ignavibacteriaceae bacterium]